MLELRWRARAAGSIGVVLALGLAAGPAPAAAGSDERPAPAAADRQPLEQVDDPFVPVAPFHDPRIAANPCITLIVTPHGGHCGFVSDASGDDDGYWAERTIVEHARELLSAD